MTKTSELNFPAIYTITHVASGKIYVGQTINLRVRWQLHRSALRKGKHRNIYLQNAWNRYGAEAFIFAVHSDMRGVLPDMLADRLNQAEIALLETVDRPYNLMDAGISGVVASAETREVLSQITTTRWMDPKHRAKQRASIIALYADPVWKAARDAAVKEGKNTTATKEAVSKQMTALWESPDHQAAQSAKRTANWKDPAYIAQQSVSRIASWKDPVKRQNRIDGIRAAWARKRAEAEERTPTVVHPHTGPGLKRKPKAQSP